MEPTTLRELLKPPFTFDKDIGIIVDANDMVIDDFADVHCTDAEMPMIAEFIVAALNEKWDRDFGEPLRWRRIFEGHGIECPECGSTFASSPAVTAFYKFCPLCGQRLLPPEEA